MALWRHISLLTVNSTTLVYYIQQALDCFATLGRLVILVSDLNIPLDSPESTRDMEITQLVADAGLIDMHHHFEKGRRCRSTWHQQRKRKMVWSRSDYFLRMDCQIIRRYKI